MDLTEAEDIKKRWQEYTEELYKKDLHNPENHNGVITHLEPDILECEVKWALESITTCVSHPDPCSHFPLHPLPLGFPSAPGPSACLMHPWLFHFNV